MHAQARRVVFIIDSDEASRVTHETILRTEGYELVSASDAALALPLLREQPPDLVLLGGKTGTMRAQRLISVIKADGLLASVRVAALVTTSARADDLLRAGADVVIPIPASPQDVVRQVVALIGRA